MAHLDRWLMRAALVGATACVVAAGLFWLFLSQPVAFAMVLERAF